MAKWRRLESLSERICNEKIYDVVLISQFLFTQFKWNT